MMNRRQHEHDYETGSGGTVNVFDSKPFDASAKLAEPTPKQTDDIKREYSQQQVKSMTLPADSMTRKDFPMFSGCLKYFPAALAGVAHISKLGNDKHNPGQPLHHARGKSMDHSDCIVRHMVDTEDLLAAGADSKKILLEADQLAWRALAYSQELHEKFGAPLAPGAKN